MIHKIKRINEMEQVNRDYIQAACKGFREIDCNVALLWSPRVGKTRAAMNIMNGESVLIVSNTELIRDSWKEEMDLYSEEWKSICYQSLKNELTGWDTIVCDEADLISENYEEILLHLKPKRFIFLTGTPTFRLRLVMNNLGKSNEKELIPWTISFQKAIDWGILPKPSITCLGLKLRDDKLKRDQLFIIGKDKKKQNVVVKPGGQFEYFKVPAAKRPNICIQCTELEYIEFVNYDIERWKTMVNNYEKWNSGFYKAETPEYNELRNIVSAYVLSPEICLNRLKQAGLLRKNFLADKKNRYIARLIKFFHLENERVLIFANSIPQAEFIDNDSECVIHSKLKLKKEELSPLEKFNEGITSRLCSVGILDRGIATRNVHTSIILQIPASQASAMQKSSRNLLDDTPRLVLAYFRDTKDEENVRKFVDQFNSKYVTFLNVANT